MLRPLCAALMCVTFAVCTATNAAIAQQAVEEKPVVLSIGDEAPEFAAKDDADKDWKSIDHVGKKILVVYFYPADMTGGCTKQACTYRDSMKDIEGEGVEVVGVSGDSVENHQYFKKAHDLNFTLLSDFDGKIAHAFGVKQVPGGKVPWTNEAGEAIELVRGVTSMRWTFVIDQDGHIAYKNEKVDPAKDPTEVMKVVAELKKK